jgi:hypothetical protein
LQGIDPGFRLPPTNICGQFLRKAPFGWALSKRHSFLTPEVAEVFCTEDRTFDFAAIDRGKIILTTMPQKFQTERR